MELEFDKEIDAILRKARAPVGAAVAALVSAHLDADAVAAFAENALPDKAKHLYMEHFADCDRCRKLLSHSIFANTEAIAAAASHMVSAPVETAVPWYLKIFRTPNLALAMGALVLTFGGVLGFLMFQNYKNQAGVSTAQVTEPERAKDDKYYSGASAANMANSSASAANAVANTANTSATNAPAMPAAVGNPNSNFTPAPGSVGRADSAPLTEAQPEKEKTAATGGAMPDAAKPVTAAPPPPPVDQPFATRDERKASEDKLKSEADTKDLAMSKSGDDRDRMAREAPQAAKKTGPNRGDGGPRNTTQNTQQEINTQQNQSVAGMIATTRSAGGKTFENRNGAWYDSAYRNQATTDVRRGTDAYKKLDGGLRKIADSIGGTIVVVWKSKAYRIN